MRHRLVPALLVLAAACSSTPSAGSAGQGAGAGAGTDASTATSAPRRGGQNLITNDEIQRTTASNAFDLVQKLRPQWLRSKSMSVQPAATAGAGNTAAIVFLNDVRYGELESLRQLDITSLRQLQFLSATEATTRWGTGYPGGAILVTANK
jgi:hypothetical protein